MENNKELDVIVWGATGFTGALVAEYLRDRYGVGGDLRWAIAGRSADKLDQLKKRLGETCDALPVLQADSHDDASLRELAARTRVVITTVGPYALYGEKLVSACVESGTHYCDLAGETQFIRKMIDTYNDAARDSGARILHCCGFDSVPSDIGVWYLQTEARRLRGSTCNSIKLFVKAAKGSLSGGTYASMLNLMEEARHDRELARMIVDPYSLNPAGEREGPDKGEQQDIRFSDDLKAWTAPFLMASVNVRVVRRSNALMGYPWGKDFRYDEAVLSGKGAAGWLKAAAMAAGLGALMAGASLDWSRNLLRKRFLPKPGEGPTREERESGFFKLVLTGQLPDGGVIKAHVSGDRDPGYGSTAKMLAECGVCLAQDDLDVGGGVWTPAAAMAAPLLDRLRANAGLTFDIAD